VTNKTVAENAAQVFMTLTSDRKFLPAFVPRRRQGFVV